MDLPLGNAIASAVTALPFPLVGLGAYTPPEAARLIGMSSQTLRRWLHGYDYSSGVRHQPPLWTPQYCHPTEHDLLGFRDLIEARIVNGLRASGIGLPTIRLCIDRAREMLGADHPFSTRAFKSDGKRIFLDITDGVSEPRMIDLKDRQHVFRDFVLPTLSGLEFGTERADRWWLTPRRTVVVDPHRAFGHPVLSDGGMLTARVAEAVRAEGSVERVARLYELSAGAIRDALRVEEQLASRLLH